MLAAPTDPSTAVRPDPRDARTTGLLYLAVAVTGVLSFLVIRARIFEEDGPAATLANRGTRVRRWWSTGGCGNYR
jgi:hypothetical protein